MTLGDSVLEWYQLDLNKQLHDIREVVKVDLLETPTNKTRTTEKMKRWANKLEYIIDAVHDIETVLAPRLEQILGTQFKDRELLSISMFQPSTKNLFLELQIHYCKRGEKRVDCEAMAELILLSDVGEILALLGDAWSAMHISLRSAMNGGSMRNGSISTLEHQQNQRWNMIRAPLSRRCMACYMLS